jgi:hypothetical protein
MSYLAETVLLKKPKGWVRGMAQVVELLPKFELQYCKNK